MFYELENIYFGQFFNKKIVFASKYFYPLFYTFLKSKKVYIWIVFVKFWKTYNKLPFFVKNRNHVFFLGEINGIVWCVKKQFVFFLLSGPSRSPSRFPSTSPTRSPSRCPSTSPTRSNLIYQNYCVWMWRPTNCLLSSSIFYGG